MRRPRPVRRIREWLGRVPPAGLAALALLGLTGFALAGVAAYRTYDYVQHDNEFCMSCHLMKEPYEAFARSEHRGLGCKACHQPTLMERSQMALAQVLERPEEIRAHAEVPNSACAGCHVDGDPGLWLQIRASEGHRVHLESDSVSLRGLKCVECHSTSIHQFSPVRETCAQSGCHEDTEMRLGKMGRLTIHCVGCHDFSRPVSDTVRGGGIAVKPLQPRREECNACHEMRVLTRDFPADEPHGAACGACHDPHRQETPRDAQKTCATAACHARADTLTPLHRGLAAGVLQECLECHPAHAFRVDGRACLNCHADVPRLPATPAARLFRGGEAPGGLELSHLRHRAVDCGACHAATPTHGAVTVASLRQCRECHHTPPVVEGCASCHGGRELRQTRHAVRTTLRFSVGGTRERALPFTHARHEGVSCTSCHREPLTLRATATCDGCHQDHHQPASRCMDCHVQAPASAHTATVHLGCGPGGCHESMPARLRDVPRTRNFCLACHQDRVSHEPGGNCGECHRLPRPGAAAAGRPTRDARGGG